MKYEIEVTKKLKSDNNKYYSVGSDIAFVLINSDTNHHDKYIGEITAINDDSIDITNIEINGEKIDGKMNIKLGTIKPNSCNHVYCD